LITSYLKYFIILVLLILIQKSIIWLLAITTYNITPDIVLIALVYIGIKKGNVEGSISGFISGLILDILSGTFIGLLALSYSIAGFIAGYFMKEDDKYLTKYYFLLILFLCSFICYFIYFEIYFQGTVVLFWEVIVKYVLSTSTYTTLISVIFVVLLRRKETEKVY
jgi:rod shape-determining protein MreD